MIINSIFIFEKSKNDWLLKIVKKISFEWKIQI